jgi:hypothetical protein
MIASPQPGPDAALLAAAEEELAQACTLDYAVLAKITPWGDTYEGYAPGGRAVIFERNYLWASEAGGDILVEVAAYPGESRRDLAAEAKLLIRKP